MFDPNQRSKAFNFALKAQEIFGLIMGFFVIWSVWALFFSDMEYIFISKVLLTLISIGFALITPLIDFNESHATNPLWTGHARFHLVWQVNAMILSSFLSLIFCLCLESADNSFNSDVIGGINRIELFYYLKFVINHIGGYSLQFILTPI